MKIKLHLPIIIVALNYFSFILGSAPARPASAPAESTSDASPCVDPGLPPTPIQVPNLAGYGGRGPARQTTADRPASNLAERILALQKQIEHHKSKLRDALINPHNAPAVHIRSNFLKKMEEEEKGATPAIRSALRKGNNSHFYCAIQNKAKELDYSVESFIAFMIRAEVRISLIATLEKKQCRAMYKQLQASKESYKTKYAQSQKENAQLKAENTQLQATLASQEQKSDQQSNEE